MFTIRILFIFCLVIMQQQCLGMEDCRVDMSGDGMTSVERELYRVLIQGKSTVDKKRELVKKIVRTKKLEKLRNVGISNNCIGWALVLASEYCTKENKTEYEKTAEFFTEQLSHGYSNNAFDFKSRWSDHMWPTTELYPPQVFRLLFENGVTLKLEDGYGSTLRSAIKTHQPLEVIKKIIQKGARADSWSVSDLAIHLVFRLKTQPAHTVQILSLLKQAGANIRQKSKLLLFELVSWESYYGPVVTKELIEWLKKEGLDINEQSEYGDTALHRAANKLRYPIRADQKYFEQTWRNLVDAGADCNMRNKKGYSPDDLRNDYGELGSYY